MAHRRFTDARRTAWEVWDVYPTNAERRSGIDRRRAPRPDPDRRQLPSIEPRVRVRPPYDQGWLAFEARHERRRLAPIPDGWEFLDDRGLDRLCNRAVAVGRPRRLVE